jgi:hypothetical protein
MRPCDRIVENSRRQRPNTMEKEPPSSRRILAAITTHTDPSLYRCIHLVTSPCPITATAALRRATRIDNNTGTG